MPVLYRGKDEYMNEGKANQHIKTYSFCNKDFNYKNIDYIHNLIHFGSNALISFLENKNVNNATISRVLFYYVPGETVYSISYLCKYSNQVISSLTLRYELGRILYDNQYDYFLLSSYKAHEPLDKAVFDVCLAKSNPLINLEGDALDAIIGMKPKWSSARVAASEIIVKASGSTGEGVGNKP